MKKKQQMEEIVDANAHSLGPCLRKAMVYGLECLLLSSTSLTTLQITSA